MARAKKMDGVPAEAAELTFEQALEQLERVVADLEDGRLGLDESITRYQTGVELLKRCYGHLSEADRKICLLTGVDRDGNPITEQWDDPQMSLEKKAESRANRRTAAGGKKKAVKSKKHRGSNESDAQAGLF